MTTPLADVAAALNRQWERLERWLEPLGDDLLGTADQPSALPGWTNGELLAHLGRAMSAVTAAMPCPPGTKPLSLAEYLGTYPGRAQEITDTTKDLAQEIAATPQATVREMARDALDHLVALGDDGDRVVQARRAPIKLRELAVSRLIELVVHADDLVTSLHGTVDSTGPADPRAPEATRIVADELLRIVVTRGGWRLEVVEPLLWVRLASGRQPYDVDALARALSTGDTATGVPDLGRMLPLF
ncbi:maleylpyruvate isomerase N-terminal domain-containing protein [Flavimobilis soli]|nr:maleylpyruvate isomerase N-terminal domain-containing protein [Flavimobilis soli]